MKATYFSDNFYFLFSICNAFLSLYFPTPSQASFFSLHPLLTPIPPSLSLLYFIILCLCLLKSSLSLKCRCHDRHFLKYFTKGIYFTIFPKLCGYVHVRMMSLAVISLPLLYAIYFKI